MRYNIPKKFTGEETYFKFFSKKALIYTSIGLSIGFIPAMFFYKVLNSQYTAIFIEILFAVPGFVLGTIILPKDRLYNGGEAIDKLIIRSIRRAIDGKVIYVTRWKGDR